MLPGPSKYHVDNTVTVRMPGSHPRRTYGRSSRGHLKSYSDGPRQTYFQPRASNVLRRQALTPTPAARQQTLTQIDFVTRTPFDYEDLELEYAAPEPARPRKKRRLTTENTETPNVQTRASRRCSLRSTDHVVKQEGSPAQVSPETHSRSHQDGIKAANLVQLPVPPQRTPRTPSRREIPSSQSPEEPISSVHSRTSVRDPHESPLKDITNRKRDIGSPKFGGNESVKLKPRLVNEATHRHDGQLSVKTPKNPNPARAVRFTSTDKENLNPFHSRRNKRLQDAARGEELEVSTPAVSIFVPDSEDATASMSTGDDGLQPRAESGNEVESLDPMVRKRYESEIRDGEAEAAPVEIQETAEQAAGDGSPTDPMTPRKDLTVLDDGKLESAARPSHSTKAVPLKPTGPTHRNPRSPLTSQHSSRPFVPVLETETQYQAAFKPFSPSMLTPSSPQETPKAAHTDDDTQPDLPPPPPPRSQSPQKRAIPPCPTSQATTVGPNFSSQYQRNTTVVPGATSSDRRTGSSSSIRTPKIKREADVVIVSSSPPKVVPQPKDNMPTEQQSESPAKSPAGKFSWDWDAVPDSQLLPDSIMHFDMPKWPGGSQDSLRTEAPVDFEEAAD